MLLIFEPTKLQFVGVVDHDRCGATDQPSQETQSICGEQNAKRSSTRSASIYCLPDHLVKTAF